MIVGIGIDVSSITRFTKLLQKPYIDKFASYITTKNELLQYHNLNNDKKALFLCKVWTVKEAVYKACDVKLRWKDIELAYYGKINLINFVDSGKPYLKFCNGIKYNAHLSITHDNGQVISVCVLEK